MTTKLFRSMVLVEAITLIVSIAVMLITFNYKFEIRTVEEMRIQTKLAADGVLYGGLEYLNKVSTDSRITWIDESGAVLYDSHGAEDNQSVREEVREALTLGEGSAKRYSETLDSNCIYYAMQLEDGSILRMSCETSFVRSLLFYMTRQFVWITLVLIYISFFVAMRVTRRIVKPLENINFDNLNSEEIYPELRPLTNQLMEQKRTIRTQLDTLLEREREFAAVTENMREGLVLFNRTGQIMSYNHSGGIILDAIAAEKGRLVISDDFAPIRMAVNNAISGHNWEEYQEYNRRIYHCLVNPVTNNGLIVGVALFMVDATEKYQREQLRREFTANVSHELKTPLTSISGFAELLMNGLVPPGRVQECAEDIYKQSQQLITLVGDIIQLSHLDEGRSFEVERVNLWHVACQIQERLRAAAERQCVEMIVSGEDCEIEGVPQIIDEMLYNLCDNAIKYNVSGGKVIVKICPGSKTTMVSVTDTGIGIPYEEQDRVFERFYRVNKSHSKEIGGTGLGLSIVKHGAQFHGAEITMNSTPGKGTTVNLLFRNCAQL